jgi:hypothetical protein
MMASDLSYALDPVLFCRGALKFDPDPWQAKLLRRLPHRLLLLTARQVGKSTTLAAAAIHHALFEPNSLILVVSPSQRQSGELFRTIMNFYRMLNNVPRLVSDSLTRAEFSNQSRIISLPGTPDTIRGIAGADLVLLDEASRIDPELIVSLRPVIATKPNARLVFLTTPAGKKGHFYERWSQSNDWEKVKVTVDQCPRITQEFLDEELRELGPQKFAQEYLLEFLDDDAAVFPLAVIQAAFASHDVVPLWN